MKDEHTEIDNLFKKGLYDIEQNVQVGAWSKISAKIDPPMSSNTFTINAVSKGKLYYAFAAAAVIIISAVWIGMQTKSATEANIGNTNSVNSVALKENYIAETLVTDTDIKEQSVQAIVKPVESKKTSGVVKITTSEERKEAMLPDGSIVLLNRNSSISYSADYNTGYTVYVTGEVFFDMTAKKSEPIHIVTPLAKIDAVESSFIISSNKENRYDEIAVSSGKVSCEPVIENQDRMLILAGNKVIIGSSGKPKKESISNVNYNDWVTQKIVFNNARLNTVCSTLEEYYNVSLTTDNAEIMNCRFTGTFERNNIDEILQVLSVSFDLSFNQNNKKYILSGSGCK